jgi:hypothetical protein
MKAYSGSSGIHSLTSALDGGEWSASRPGRFTPREGAPGTAWIGIVTANILTQTGEKGWYSSLGLGVGLTTPQCRKTVCYEML